MKHPSIAIITNTFNPDLAVFERCLKAVKKQRYPGRIRQYLLDGGSNTHVLAMARKYHCRVLSFHNDKNEGLSRLYGGLQSVQEKIVLILESDNIMTSSHWIRDMVEPFCEKNVFSTYSMHNGYKPKDDILTRYFALMGSPDPTLSYLGKSDKIRMDQQVYDKGEILKDTKKYSVVRFTSENQPVMGDNGFMIYTNLLRTVVHKGRPFFHTDEYAQLLHKGYDTVGVVKNSIIHISRPNMIDQVRRRVEVKKHFTEDMKGKRKYLVYNPDSPDDRRNLFWFVFYALTLIQPLSVSIRGYTTIADVAWFLHPVMCFLMVVFYGWSEIERKMKSLASSI